MNYYDPNGLYTCSVRGGDNENGDADDDDPCQVGPVRPPNKIPIKQPNPERQGGGHLPPICDSKIFESQYLGIFKQMGKDLDVNPAFIMAIALQESGWNLSHVYETNSSSNNRPLNNLFGMTNAGGNNIAYTSVKASADAWEANWGKYLSNHPTTIGAFVDDLLSDPTHMYNAFPNYKTSIVGGTYPVPVNVRGGTPQNTTKGVYPSLVDALNRCHINLN